MRGNAKSFSLMVSWIIWLRSFRKTVPFLLCTFAFSLLCVAGCKGNNPPDIPLVPLGSSSGDIGNYTFLSSTIDPDEDSISIKFDWGEGTESQWSDYVASGDTVSMTHFYADSGIFYIQAKAKDEEGAESDWSNSHMLDISRAILWTKKYGGAGDDYGHSVKETSAGEYVIAGYTNSYGAGGSDVYFIKTDMNGNLVRENTYGGSYNDRGYSIWETFDGGYILVGYTNSPSGGGYGDVYLIKTDANGIALWEKTYGGAYEEYGYSVQETTDGGYIIVGNTASFGAGDLDVYLIKTDASGDTLWTKTYGGTEHDCGYSVSQTQDGGYIVTGYTASFGAGSDAVYLIKTDANGNTLWTKTYGGTQDDRGRSVQQTMDGGYIVAGYTNYLSVTVYDVYLIKTDANGNVIWEETYGESFNEYGYSVQQTMDGGYIVAGHTSSFGVSVYDVYLIKTDGNGNLLWERICGEWRFDYGYSVCETIDGSYVVAGCTNSSGAGGFDVYLIKSAP